MQQVYFKEMFSYQQMRPPLYKHAGDINDLYHHHHHPQPSVFPGMDGGKRHQLSSFSRGGYFVRYCPLLGALLFREAITADGITFGPVQVPLSSYISSD